MVSTHWEPFGMLLQDVGRFRREMNRLLGPFGPEEAPAVSAPPPVSVWEDEDRLYVEVELPGMKLEDLDIRITKGNVLTVRGERKPPEVGRKVWHRQERGFGPFERTVVLPVPVEAGKVEARYEGGVLFVTLPRAESAKPRRIPVKGG
jgi:HSP20 family protein